jgi:hypothetical protein
MQVINKLGFLLLAVLLIGACKKEKSDSSAPVIEIVEPGHLSFYFSVDTIIISALISDDQKIKSVSARLINDQSIVFGTFSEMYPMTLSYEYNSVLELDRPDMLSGNYFIEFSASDGVNVKKTFREIFINEVPLEIKSKYVSSGGINNQDVSEFSTEGLDLQSSQIGDVSALYANSLRDQLIVVTGTGGQVRAFEYPEFDLKWSYDIENNTPFRSITASSFNQESQHVLLGDSDGFMRVLNNNGNVILGFSSDQTLFKPVNGLLTNSMIYFVEKRLDGSDQNFNAYFLSSGVLNLRLNLNGNVVSLFEDRSSVSIEDHDEVVLFINSPAGPELRVYDRPSGGFSIPINLPAGVINSACKISRHRYVFQINNTVYHYTFSGPLQIYLEGSENISGMEYDKFNNRLVCVTPTGIRSYSLQGGFQSVEFVPVSMPRYTALLYNR